MPLSCTLFGICIDKSEKCLKRIGVLVLTSSKLLSSSSFTLLPKYVNAKRLLNGFPNNEVYRDLGLFTMAVSKFCIVTGQETILHV